ncbi:MAG: GNAT family N-acetyltransferase [Desulfamplus sp.]|nr:GNAT family N-acetyltransferase [Desulfamplus sp.]
MIRKANQNDIKSIAQIIVNAWQTAYSGIVKETYLKTIAKEKYIKIFTNNITNQLEDIFVYCDANDNVLGFVSGKVAEDQINTAEIVGFYIEPKYQNQKIGKQLFKHIINFNKNERNVDKVFLWTLKNAKNNEFYKKLNGKIQEEKKIEIGNIEYDGIKFVYNI